MTDAPDEVFLVDVPPAPMTVDGEVLQALVDEPTGAWKAVTLDGVDPASLPAAVLPYFIRGCAQVQAWAAAMATGGIAELAARGGVDGIDADVAVAFALTEPVGTAQQRIWQARRLTRFLPATMARFRLGELSAAQAAAMVDATGQLQDRAVCAAVEERVLPTAAGKVASELKRHARRVVDRLDPGAAQRRARAARADADVTLHPGEDGMGTVVAALPVEDAGVVKSAVDAYAMTRKNAGDDRRVGVLRAEGLTRMCSDYLTGTSTLGAAPRAGGRPIEIGVTVGVRTALGLDQLPAEVPDQGLVPREVITEMIATEQPRLRLLVVDETTGRLVHRAVTSYRPTAAQIAHVRAAYVRSVGPGSQVPATRTDTDHALPHPTGPTAIGNLLPLDRRWHRAKTNRSLSVTIDHTGTVTWTTVFGMTRTVTPYDYRLDAT